MSHRFFVEPPISKVPGPATVSGPEGHHISRVMRGKPGDKLIAFDGSGDEFVACIEECKRDVVHLQIEERREISREASRPIHLACAMPKGDRQRVLIEKAVELGVASLIPLQTEFSNETYKDKSRDRWARYVIDASKQCGRNRLMEIKPISNLTELFENSEISNKVLLHPYPLGGEPVAENQNHAETPSPLEPILIGIGPEGGFSDSEAQDARQAGWKLITLGPRILRVETAAVLAVCCSLTDRWTVS